MDFSEYQRLLKKSRDSDSAQFDKDMAEDRRAAERREKESERLARKVAKELPDDDPKSPYRSKSYLEAAEKAGLKISPLKPKTPPKPSGRASSMDLEGGMRPGQSPSLDNPIKMAKGGKVSSASSRAEGCAVKGKTKGRFV